MANSSQTSDLTRIDQCIRQTQPLLDAIDGWLSDREAAFLLQIAAMPTCAGEILAIGAHAGKGPIALARGAALADRARVTAIDLDHAPQLRTNLDRAGVADAVRVLAGDSRETLAAWRTPLRVVWHDGSDDTEAATDDVALVRRWLADGAILAFHDVLNLAGERVFVFTEGILGDEQIGACGMVGSIGWAQFHHHAADARVFASRKERLQRQLRRLQQFHNDADPTWLRKMHYRMLRSMVPHQRIDPEDWQRQVA